MYVIVREMDFQMFIPKYPNGEITSLNYSGDFFVGYVSTDEIATCEDAVPVMVELPGEASIHLTVPFEKIAPQSLNDAERTVWIDAIKRHAVPGGKV